MSQQTAPRSRASSQSTTQAPDVIAAEGDDPTVSRSSVERSAQTASEDKSSTEEPHVESSELSESETAPVQPTEDGQEKPQLSAGTSILPRLEISTSEDSAEPVRGHINGESHRNESYKADGEDELELSAPKTQDPAAAAEAAESESPEAGEQQDGVAQPVQVVVPDEKPSAIRQGQRHNLGGSLVFTLAALDQLIASKDAKGSRASAKELREACESAKQLAKEVATNPNVEFDPKAIFEPFRLACDDGRSTTTQTIALDCIGKMVSYGFLSDVSSEAASGQSLSDLVIVTICQLPPTSASSVTLQQLKALLALVLAGLARQSALLHAVRTTYDVFLLSKDPQTQAVAQGVLTQMCSATFARIKPLARGGVPAAGQPHSPTAGATAPEPDVKAETAPGDSAEDATSDDHQARVTLKDMESRASFDQAAPGLDRVQSASTSKLPTVEQQEQPTGLLPSSPSSKEVTEEEVLVKDAFLVLRALCKLSMKPLSAESERDLRSHGMRSKLLSLRLILGILQSHLYIFDDSDVTLSSSTTGERTPLVQAVKQYLCLTLSRNAVSPVNSVFEVACEIFWAVLSGLRTKLKKEIEVLLNEIFLPILEMRNSSSAQKHTLLGIFMRVCEDPQALVEIYLNYDCDRTALDNVYERLINVISRISQTQLTQDVKDKAKEALAAAEQQRLQQGDVDEAKSRTRLPTQRLSTSSTLSGSISTASNLGTVPTGASDAATSSLGSSEANNVLNEPIEMRLKRQSLECLCAVLRSLVVWSQRGEQRQAHEGPNVASTESNGALNVQGQNIQPISPRISEDARFGDEVGLEEVVNAPGGITGQQAQTSAEASRVVTPETGLRTSGGVEDDPTRFQDAKQRKTILLEGIRKFNQKPKRGVAFLLQHGYIRSQQPSDVAKFLLYADGLSKAQIGEYLGEGEPENIAVMHAFVDLINFDNMPFTAALRRFLQAFRLPGESQKIDRYMLKFAERYVAGNPKVFANADTAYVFAYSVIMLNTDAHNPQVKHRMTLKDFLRNNEGIDDGKSLPEEYIASVYEEIQVNEIKMKDEQLAAATTAVAPAGGFAGAIATVGRDLQREAYVLQSEGMANKTEALFRTMVRAQRRIHPQQRAAAEQFFSASHFEHVRPMFEVAWMAFLAGISNPMQESDDPDTINRCLDAFQDAIHIVCLFGMELERNAFVTTLTKFTFLNNLGEMKPKNVEAIKTLLGIAQSEGDYLKGSWREVLACVSQLERFQLISGGVDERQLPEVGRRVSRSTSNQAASKSSAAALPGQDVVEAGISTEVTVAADMVFSSSAKLTGDAIVDFVQCLAENSWEEIQSSGMTDHPRLFSLQKLVEISYYNMKRIRLEWSSMWAILGQHFNQVCTHPNPRVSAFALDSLRQLSNRFLELEELPNFKFQKDFLKPFEYTMRNTTSSEAKEMVLSCLQQMILSRTQNMVSGWRTLFGTLGAAARSNERVASHAFELVRGLYSEHFDAVIIAGAFADLTVCLTDFAKATEAQKIALRSVELLTNLVPAMLESPVCPLDADGDPGPPQSSPPSDDPMVRFWFPSLFAFYDIIMNGDDLEVRRVALDALFSILKRYGSTFRLDFWATVCQEVIFPIFSVLRSRSDVSRFSTQEDMSVWLSTTMIQALRNLVSLWTHYFETLEDLLPKLLNLLCACICQENDTLARIGTSCLQQLLESNVRKLSEAQWVEVVDAFLELFRTTTAHQLFDPALRSDHIAPTTGTDARSYQQQATSQDDLYKSLSVNETSRSSSTEDARTSKPLQPLTSSERRRIFKQIIVKCVLQLLLIETTHELLSRPIVYELIPPAELLRLTTVLETSHRFSKKFNADKDLRMALWKVGFMKQLPNLLKQESSSAATLVSILVRLHGDTRESHRALRAQVRKKFVPLGEEVVNSYLPLDPETQGRNVAAWTPVVAEVFRGICTFTDVADGEEVNQDETSSSSNGSRVFTHHAKIFYPLAVDLLSREPLAASIGEALRTFFYRVGVAQGMIDEPADRERRRLIQEGRDTEKGLRSVSMDNLAATGSPHLGTSSSSTLALHHPAEQGRVANNTRASSKSPLSLPAMSTPTNAGPSVGGLEPSPVESSFAPTPPAVSHDAYE
ncbi:unnamed protein product [Parajaminaea phylloscopi]